MKSAAMFFVLALAVAAPCIAYPSIEHNEKDAEASSLKQDERPFETLEEVLQAEDFATESRALLADLASKLGALHGTDAELDENTSEYFLKKLRRVVENVAKAVVINKAAGAIAGMLG